jgi:sulfite reductase alpha subunit-like flavoprotein
MRLKQLGATELVPLGLGDDQAKYGYLTALDPWTSSLWDAIYTLTSCKASSKLEIIEHLYQLKVLPGSDHLESITHNLPDDLVAVTETLAEGTVLENTRITSASWNQDVRHFRIQLQLLDGSAEPCSYIGSAYRGGDVAYLYPQNNHKDVVRMLNILSRTNLLSLESWIEVKNLSENPRKRQLTDAQCTLGALLSKCLDINAIPQRSFFEAIALYSENEEEKEKLIEIASGEGTDLYLDYCVKEKRSYLDILEDFRSVKLPLEVVLELVPRLAPRLYSIASSGLVVPDEIHLCIGLVSYSTRFGRKKKGVCSRYVAALKPGDRVSYSIRRGSFVHAMDKPLVMIGPGTGVAPMRAIIQERLSQPNASLDTLLFFGCRRRDSDYLYENEWNTRCQVLTSSSLSNRSKSTQDANQIVESSRRSVAIISAFSRDQDSKEYVTHKILEHGALIWSLISAVCCLYELYS